MDTRRKDDLIAMHRAATSERERAEIEVRIWTELRPHGLDTRQVRREQFVVGILGDSVSATDIDSRIRLYSCGDTADPIWPRVDGDMLLRGGLHLMQRAKKTKGPGENIYQAVARVLAEYDALPHVRRVQGGKVVRQQSSTRLVRERPRGVRSRTKADPVDAERAFWQSLRAIIGPEFQRRMVGQSEMVVSRELTRFETELKVLFQQAAARASQQRNGALSETLLRRRLGSACEALKIDPPTRGTRPGPEFFRKAQKQFKALAREYHPDSHGGSDVTRPLYDAVVQAWNVLRDYEEALTAAAPAAAAAK